MDSMSNSIEIFSYVERCKKRYAHVIQDSKGEESVRVEIVQVSDEALICMCFLKVYDDPTITLLHKWITICEGWM